MSSDWPYLFFSLRFPVYHDATACFSPMYSLIAWIICMIFFFISLIDVYPFNACERHTDICICRCTYVYVGSWDCRDCVIKLLRSNVRVITGIDKEIGGTWFSFFACLTDCFERYHASWNKISLRHAHTSRIFTRWMREYRPF